MKWISHVSSEHGFGVRIPTRPPKTMSITEFRKFKKTDTEAVINLWETCKLVVDWNDPLKDIKRKLSVKDNLFIIGEIN